MTMVTTNEVTYAREQLLRVVSNAKSCIIRELDGGTRDYDRISLLVKDYASLMKACDVLAGYAELKPPFGRNGDKAPAPYGVIRNATSIEGE